MDYNSNWEFELAIMTALGIENLQGISGINIQINAQEIPILTIRKVINSEQQKLLVDALEKYEINIVPALKDKEENE